MIEKYEALKSAAMAATSGPWAYEPHGDTDLYGVGVLLDDKDNQLSGRQECGEMLVVDSVAPEINGVNNAAFIAMANPATVLELVDENQYMRMKIKEMDLLFGGLLLTMQAAVIELEHGEGPAAAMQWIFNKLLGPGEFAPDSEKDAQAYFNRKSEEIDAEFSKCMEYFTARNEAKKLGASKAAGDKS